MGGYCIVEICGWGRGNPRAPNLYETHIYKYIYICVCVCGDIIARKTEVFGISTSRVRNFHEAKRVKFLTT